MKRRDCSYDRFAVPDPSFVLKNVSARCTSAICDAFCVWSVQLATRPTLSTEDKTGAYSLTTPLGEDISSQVLWMWRGGQRPLLE
jgi:hypothetical protein